MRVQLGRLVSLGEEHEYRPGLDLNRIFKTGLREGLERGLIVSRHATRAIGIDSRQTIRWELSNDNTKRKFTKTGTSLGLKLEPIVSKT